MKNFPGLLCAYFALKSIIYAVHKINHKIKIPYTNYRFAICTTDFTQHQNLATLTYYNLFSSLLSVLFSITVAPWPVAGALVHRNPCKRLDAGLTYQLSLATLSNPKSCSNPTAFVACAFETSLKLCSTLYTQEVHSEQPCVCET